MWDGKPFCNNGMDVFCHPATMVGKAVGGGAWLSQLTGRTDTCLPQPEARRARAAEAGHRGAGHMVRPNGKSRRLITCGFPCSEQNVRGAQRSGANTGTGLVPEISAPTLSRTGRAASSTIA